MATVADGPARRRRLGLARPAPRTSAWSAAVTATTRADLRTVVRVDPLALTTDKLQLLALLGPPLITSHRGR